MYVILNDTNEKTGSDFHTMKIASKCRLIEVMDLQKKPENSCLGLDTVNRHM